MITFDITHTTRYRYAQPVQLGDHRVMFRPRDSHDLRVLATDLQVNPPAQDIRLIQDVYSNSVAVVTPQASSDVLEIVCSFTVEHTGTRVLDLPVDPAAEFYPFAYSADDRDALAHYAAPYYADPDGVLQAWAQRFVPPNGAVRSLDILVEMTRDIRESMSYEARYAEGVQAPAETLALARGTCRDFATLMMEAARTLGFAARFVSGYLYSPQLDAGEGEAVGAGATHAWVQVYLPGAGWLPFDPTNNLVGGSSLIRVGVARHAALASPVKGSWTGLPTDFLGLDVDVQVHRRA